MHIHSIHHAQLPFRTGSEEIILRFDTKEPAGNLLDFMESGASQVSTV